MRPAHCQHRSLLRVAGVGVLGLLCLGLAVKKSWSLATPFGRGGVSSAMLGPIPASQMELGRQVYMRTCFVCHQPDGRGLPGQMPPLAQSDYLMADPERSIRIVLGGQTGRIVVNGKAYNGIMLPLYYLTDDEVANVLTYVRNSFGNVGPAVTPEDVRRVRATVPPPEANPYE